MKDTLPMTLVARMDDVAVFQTAARLSTVGTAPDNRSKTAQQSQHLASYGELNLGLHVNDDAKAVLNNRMQLLTAINQQLADLSSSLSPNALSSFSLSKEQRPSITHVHWVNQVHGKQVYEVGASAWEMQPHAADAMVSHQDGIGLAIMTADCVPIVLYQPLTGQIAAIHAGWQGLACGVIQATAVRFDDSGEITAWIGVCISQDNYEVGTDVPYKLRQGCIKHGLLSQGLIADFDQRYVTDTDANANDRHRSGAPHLHKAVAKVSSCATVSARKVKLDLPRLAADQLTAAGITVSQQSANACSYADDRYYSYRRQTHLQQPATGRMALIITRRASI